MATQPGEAHLNLMTAPVAPFLSTDSTWQIAWESGGTLGSHVPSSVQQYTNLEGKKGGGMGLWERLC